MKYTKRLTVIFDGVGIDIFFNMFFIFLASFGDFQVFIYMNI